MAPIIFDKDNTPFIGGVFSRDPIQSITEVAHGRALGKTEDMLIDYKALSNLEKQIAFKSEMLPDVEKIRRKSLKPGQFIFGNFEEIVFADLTKTPEDFKESIRKYNEEQLKENAMLKNEKLLKDLIYYSGDFVENYKKLIIRLTKLQLTLTEEELKNNQEVLQLEQDIYTYEYYDNNFIIGGE